MDEKTAWRIFCSTGKIDDYMRYSRIKNVVTAEAQPQCIKENTHADQDGWNRYQGTDYR